MEEILDLCTVVVTQEHGPWLWLVVVYVENKARSLVWKRLSVRDAPNGGSFCQDVLCTTPLPLLFAGLKELIESSMSNGSGKDLICIYTKPEKAGNAKPSTPTLSQDL